MKKVLLAFLVLSLSIGFILAATYHGDGVYESFSAGDTIIADNEYSLNFVELRQTGIAGGMTNAFYEAFSSEGDKIGNFTLVDVHNPTTRFFVFNSLEGTPVINVTFTRSASTSPLHLKVESLSSVENQPDKNITYGQCVAQKAEIKNTCFASVKSIRDVCKAPAKESKNKEALKQCRLTYRDAKKQCKVAFKLGKEECSSIE
jgi:hypothetical protein